MEAAVDYYIKAIVMGSKEFEVDMVVSTGSNSTTSYGANKAERYFYKSPVESGNAAGKNKKLMTQ